jgi:type VI secretion system protein ImpC
MRVSTTFGKPLPQRAILATEAPEVFRILVLGDLGGTRVWGKPVAVDRDNLDEVLQQLDTQVTIQGDPRLPDMTITFEEWEDFHPDRLYQRLEVFAALRTRRQRLESDATFAEEAKAILDAGELVAPETAEPQTPEAPPPSESADSGDVVGDLLSAAVEQTEVARKPVLEQIVAGNLNVDAMVQQLVRPYVLQKSDPRKPEFLAAVDEAISETMRYLLRHPAFRRVERAWLGIRMLARRLETDRTLQISLLNVPEPQLRHDVCRDDDLSGSQLYNLLVNEPSVAGGEPWTVVVGDFTFDGSSESTDLLGRVAQIHDVAGSVFVAGGAASIVGCESLATCSDPDDWNAPDDDVLERWNAVRSLPAARRVVLALPRVMGRRPYGADSEPLESFSFEEVPEVKDHEDFPWVNAAFAVATLLGESFSRGGWSVSAAWQPSLEKLPLYVYEEAGESLLKPCGEVELQLRAGRKLAEAGLTAVHSVRDHDAVLIPSLVCLSNDVTTPTAVWS